MLVKNFLSVALLVVLFVTTNANAQDAKVVTTPKLTIDGHPAWIMQGNIYEVNVRQYTPEGTFKAFAKHLPRLKQMGVQTLWFMPINPIGILDRKGELGSYYAVRNYEAINPEFGTMADWKALVKQCHKMGFKVIIDWVPNHTAADHYWMQSHPDFYVQDSITHKAISPFDWTDARKLNYKNPELCDTMIANMEFWLNETHIDGFRCDVAFEVPQAFWQKCIAKLKKGRNIFMLAEASLPWLHKAGFDATYTWPDYNVMKDIVKGKMNALDLDSSLNDTEKDYPKNAIKMYFTSNHDLNSWELADYGTMPGKSHAPFAVLSQTMKRSVPLIYTGQEEPHLDSISFFYKNTISFKKFARAEFYSKLLKLRKSNEALAANASYTKLKSTDDKKVFAYIREKNGRKVLVVLNLSPEPISTAISNPVIAGNAMEIFTNKSVALKVGEKFNLDGWGYKVFNYVAKP